MAPLPPPAGTRLPVRLLPLLPIAVATIAAFGAAIRCNWEDLSVLWTQGSREPLLLSLPFGSARGPQLQLPLPTPLAFAVSFFQTAHASTRSRLEQAAIAAFLAGLATVTAVESARAQAWQTSEVRRRTEVRDEKSNSLVPTENVVAVVEGENKQGSSLSAKVVRNLAVPWLLYNLALGALSWQGIIIPAFILQQQQQQQQPRGFTGSVPGSSGSTTAISLSILLGLLFPAGAMILNPSAPAPVLAWLAFPLWVSLARRATSALFGKKLTAAPAGGRRLPTTTDVDGDGDSSSGSSSRRVYALPILASAVAHLLLVAHILLGAEKNDHHRGNSSLTRSAMLLLEIDHAAIFASVLYWVFTDAGGLRAVAATIAVTLALGPGAGVCAGWMYRDHLLQQDHSVHLASPGDETAQLRAERRRRRRYGKATGHFFGGPLEG